eukprot:Sspe_Gene.103090::Locus_78914_Transcript_1_1_Confidence_1.000_Length_737::g.103090::m.103090
MKSPVAQLYLGGVPVEDDGTRYSPPSGNTVTSIITSTPYDLDMMLTTVTTLSPRGAPPPPLPSLYPSQSSPTPLHRQHLYRPAPPPPPSPGLDRVLLVRDGNSPMGTTWLSSQSPVPGLYLTHVAPGSPAEVCGLTRYLRRRVALLNDRPIHDTNDILAVRSLGTDEYGMQRIELYFAHDELDPNVKLVSPDTSHPPPITHEVEVEKNHGE